MRPVAHAPRQTARTRATDRCACSREAPPPARPSPSARSAPSDNSLQASSRERETPAKVAAEHQAYRKRAADAGLGHETHSADSKRLERLRQKFEHALEAALEEPEAKRGEKLKVVLDRAEKLLSASGMRVERVECDLPSGGKAPALLLGGGGSSSLGRFASSAGEKLEQRLLYSPGYLEETGFLAAQGNGEILLPHDSIASLRATPSTVHETRHAYLSQHPESLFNGDVALSPDSPLRQEGFVETYQEWMSLQELSTYTREAAGCAVRLQQLLAVGDGSLPLGDPDFSQLATELRDHLTIAREMVISTGLAIDAVFASRAPIEVDRWQRDVRAEAEGAVVEVPLLGGASGVRNLLGWLARQVKGDGGAGQQQMVERLEALRDSCNRQGELIESAIECFDGAMQGDGRRKRANHAQFAEALALTRQAAAAQREAEARWEQR